MNGPSEGAEFQVAAENAGVRLDRFLAAQLPELSRNRIQSLVDDGYVLVDGTPQRASHRIARGETIKIDFPVALPSDLEPEAIPLDILYEDDDVAVINKPAGMIVHPGAGAEHGTLVAALLAHFGGPNGLSSVGGPLRPGIVHRLDKETSGVIVVARTDAAHASLASAFSNQLVAKTYVALLRRRPNAKTSHQSGRIDLPIARDLHRRTRMTTRRRDGRPARTDWRVRAHIGNYSLVEADLHTGRTHQIRVHFSAVGWPVVGDTVYGAPREERVGKQLLPPLGRNFLHSARIAFEHPRTRQRLEFRAPLPGELVDYLRALARATETPVNAIDAAISAYL